MQGFNLFEIAETKGDNCLKDAILTYTEKSFGFRKIKMQNLSRKACL
jgi:hypothetical protein